MKLITGFLGKMLGGDSDKVLDYFIGNDSKKTIICTYMIAAGFIAMLFGWMTMEQFVYWEGLWTTGFSLSMRARAKKNSKILK